MSKEKDGILEEGVQVSITTVHRWRNELGWSSKSMIYCQSIREANLEKRLLVTRSINHHSVSRSVSRSVGQSVSWSTPIHWRVFHKKYHTCNDPVVQLTTSSNQQSFENGTQGTTMNNPLPPGLSNSWLI